MSAVHLNGRARLEFFAWECGHHQACPAPIEGITSPEQALSILLAIGAAIAQPGSARARLINEADHTFVSFYMTDDYAVPETRIDDWRPFTAVLVGPDLVGNRRSIDALTWHLGLEDHVLDGWDGQAPLGEFGPAVVTTALSLAEVQALPRDPGSQPLRIVEVTPELLATALEDAIESGIVQGECEGVAA